MTRECHGCGSRLILDVGVNIMCKFGGNGILVEINWYLSYDRSRANGRFAGEKSMSQRIVIDTFFVTLVN